MADTNPPAGSSDVKTEFPCPDCGEMVREGLVRCWNCGGFLRADIEQKYQQMQEQPAKVIFSLPEVTDADQDDIDSLMVGDAGGSDEGSSDGGETSTSVEQTAEPQEAEADQPAADAEGDSASETGGGVDALMELAAAEEQERGRRGAGGVEGVKVIRDGFLIDAPKGCRIQVRDERTGEMRRLTFGASSRVRISMLDKLAAIAKAKKKAAATEKETEAPDPSYGKYRQWMSDIRLHTINPAKLKLVADSLAKEFVQVETGFADDGLLIVSLPVAKKGLFGGGASPEDFQQAREALLEHLRAGKEPNSEGAKLVGDVNLQYTADQLAELRIVQPAASLTESLFAGIPVFGEGQIAVQLPIVEAGEQPKVMSFTLSGFRDFVEIVGSIYSLAEFGRNLGIPLTDTFEEHKCHLSGDVVKTLAHLEFYKADPALETIVAGYQCETCGIVVSENARVEQNLGGKDAKGIAKAKCPKCEQKMGHVPLYTLSPSDDEPSASEDVATSEAD